MGITSFRVTEKNKEELVYYRRQRWKMSIKEVSTAITQTLTHKILNLTRHNKI